jgi:phosphoribosylanthranilate isomerase
MFYVRVKICGITRPEDAELVIELGGWAIGFVLWPGSKRACPPEVAAGISRHTRRQISLVGVFVNAPIAEVVEAADMIGLSHVQLQGEEGPTYCEEVRHRTGCEVIKALRVKSGAVVNELGRYHPDYFLLDSSVGDAWGGTGEVWDWSTAESFRTQKPIILSGGLNASNVGEAIRLVRPWAVDVASGVESAPGEKDPEKLAEFFAAVEAASPKRSEVKQEPENAVSAETADSKPEELAEESS